MRPGRFGLLQASSDSNSYVPNANVLSGCENIVLLCGLVWFSESYIRCLADATVVGLSLWVAQDEIEVSPHCRPPVGRRNETHVRDEL